MEGIKMFLMYILGGATTFAFMVFWASYDMLRHGFRNFNRHAPNKAVQSGGAGNDDLEQNNITINLNSKERNNGK